MFITSTTIVSDVLSYDVWPCSENAGNMNKSMAGNKNIIEKFFKLVRKRILKLNKNKNSSLINDQNIVQEYIYCLKLGPVPGLT